VLEDEALHVGAREPVARDRLRVLGTEDHEELALREVPADVRAERDGRVGDGASPAKTVTASASVSGSHGESSTFSRMQ
jgi:hypothetical protein